MRVPTHLGRVVAHRVLRAQINGHIGERGRQVALFFHVIELAAGVFTHLNQRVLTAYVAAGIGSHRHDDQGVDHDRRHVEPAPGLCRTLHGAWYFLHR